MQTTAKLRHLKIAPRKTRLVIDMVRGLNVVDALVQLELSTKRAALPVKKLIDSAVANAEHNNELKKDNLFIKEIKVDEGPVLKRWRARAFGRAAGIRKKTSHITVVLDEINPTEVKKEKKEIKKVETKVVSSLDEIKDSGAEDIDKIEAETEDKKEDKKDEKGRAKELFDVVGKGKGRGKQNMDRLEKKEKGGKIKRVFNRKSG